jgi:adenylate cyclase class 2
MIEVEIKLPLFRRSITERALTDCGFKAGNLVKESDFYFTSDFHDFMKTDEALRIRTCENFTTRETTSFLTYKGAKLDTVSTTRKELETRIEDADIAREILISLGYKKLYPVTKLRQYYHKGRMTACVDQVEILVDSPEQKESALQSIEALLLDMGSSLKETTRKSYLSMLLSKGSPD